MMARVRAHRAGWACACVGVLAGLVNGQSPDFRLTSAQVVEESTTVTSRTTTMEEDSWTIEGPIRLRSADPTETGELEIKNIGSWETTRGEEDEFEYELELEYGLSEDHELLLALPFQIGDGRIEGNGDVTLGWHWRLWREEGWRPAFAMRNFVRIPTGVDSNGVDYEWIGLLTKTIVPGSTRLHLNPFLASINGDNNEEARPFRWGAAFGVDHRLNDDWLLVADYRYENGEEEGTRDNHTLEVGADWRLAEQHKLGFVVQVGLDGDDSGPALGASVSYILSIEP